MFRPLVWTLSLALIAPALALQAQPEHDEALVPYLKQGYRQSKVLTRDDPKLGTVQAILLEEGEGAAHHRSVVFVFAGKGERKLIHQAEYAWAMLDRLVDVDRDGNLDLVLRAGNLGNCWACGWIEAVTLATPKPAVLIPAERFQELEDVDGDGTLEAVALDTHWEFYEGLCHACSPRLERIYKRTNGEWVEASAAFPAYYRKAVMALEEELAHQADENPADWDEYQLGTLISILLNRVQLGEREAALKAFDDQIAKWRERIGPREPEARARLDSVVAAIKRDLK